MDGLRHRPIIGLAALVAAALLAAGCVAPEEYQVEGPPEDCQYPYVTLHIGGLDGVTDEEIRAAFVEAGYEWEIARQGVAYIAAGNADVAGVVSFDPGISSAQELILSFIATSPTVPAREVELEADAAAAVVEEAFGDAVVAERISDVWSSTCGEIDPLELAGAPPGAEIAPGPGVGGGGGPG